MTNTFYRTALKASTALVAVAAFASPGFAQVDDQDNEVAAGPQGQATSGPVAEPIVITGSRIARPQVDSAAPVAVVQDEEFKLSGAVNVEQVVNTLPQVVPGTTAFSNNPGGGVATLNLRGLGETRTMVLVNGRRYMFYDSNQIVDLNTIPQFLIDSVDVVTGGASAVYGSDAIAGVVNFKLRNDLDGAIAGGQYSITEEGDGPRYNAYVALGGELGDGRGHATVYAEYYKRDPIFQSARDFSRFALNDRGGELVQGGSSVVPQGRFQIDSSALVGFDADGDAILAPLAAGNFSDAFFENPGVSRPTASDTYNYAPANYLQVAQERYLLGGYADYEIVDGVTAYTEVSFVNNRVPNELAATPITGNFNINIDAVAPYLSDADAAALREIDANETAINLQRQAFDASLGYCGPGQETPEGATACLGNLYGGPDAAANAAGVVNSFVYRRTTETGSRNSLDERNAFRGMVGLRGDIDSNWNYDAYYMYSRTRNSNIQAGNISRSAFQEGLNPTSEDTIPINIFGPNTLTPAMVDQISILAQNGDVSELQVANASVNGTFGSLGMGGGDAGIAVGVEYRKVSSDFIPDTALASGDVIGFNAGQPTAGSYDAKEVFAELYLPVAANMPGVERLDLTAAGRYSDYSLDAVGGVWTYAGGVEYQPIPDITLRGQYQRAIRAPNVEELFGGQSNGFPGAIDPCGTDAALTDATLRALCIATGVPDPAVNPTSPLGSPDPDNPFATQLGNDQIQGVFGGNPNLSEETSESWTAGIILEPRFLPGLTITADYFNIEIEDAISTFGGGLSNTLDLCYNVIQDADSVYCQVAAAGRNANGVFDGINPVEILNANIATLETSGVDLQAAWGTDLTDDTRLNLSFLGTWTEKNDFTPVADLPDEVTECSGRFGLACGTPTPEWKWTTRASLISGPMTGSVRWRHLSSVRDDNDDVDYVVEKIGAYDLIDLTLSVEANEMLTFTAGVNNIFDKTPDLVGSNQAEANTYPNVYDVLGRDYFVSAALRF